MRVAGKPRSDPAGSRVHRQRNARGQGDRLRAEILEAASALLAESGDTRQLSLRSVARRVGIAATSMYLHFPDVEHLTAAVAELHFAELGYAVARASRASKDPLLSLMAGCKAYCWFAIRNPGHYRVLFDVTRPDLGPSLPSNLEQSPGQALFLALVGAIERCQQAGVAAADADPRQLAILLWATLHGIISLRLSRPRSPWPRLEELVDDAVRALLAGSRVGHGPS